MHEEKKCDNALFHQNRKKNLLASHLDRAEETLDIPETCATDLKSPEQCYK